MKKIIAGLLGVIAFVGLQGDNGMSTMVSLYNNYGAAIVYRFNSSETEPLVSLANGSEIKLGLVDEVTRLDIQSTSRWSFSSPASLMGVIDFIKALKISNSARIFVNANNDKVINALYKLNNVNGWQISIDWPTLREAYAANPGKRLQMLLQGHMGSALKERALKIYMANYSGKENLKEVLRSRIETTDYHNCVQLIDILISKLQ